jgi:hypothetical protein
MPIWNIFQTFGIFYNHLAHFVFIRYIFPVLVLCTKKNLATLDLNLRFPSVEDSPEPSIAITGSQMSANPSMAMANGGKSSYLGTVYFLAKISVTMCTHLKLQWYCEEYQSTYTSILFNFANFERQGSANRPNSEFIESHVFYLCYNLGYNISVSYICFLFTLTSQW